MQPAYCEDLQPGQTCLTRAVTLTQSWIIASALRFDPQPIHSDAVPAREGAFGGDIASGLRTLALACRLIQQTRRWMTATLGSPGIGELRRFKPVRPGDTLHVLAEIRGGDPRTPSRSGGRCCSITWCTTRLGNR
jgi:acyl dehydratase